LPAVLIAAAEAATREILLSKIPMSDTVAIAFLRALFAMMAEPEIVRFWTSLTALESPIPIPAPLLLSVTTALFEMNTLPTTENPESPWPAPIPAACKLLNVRFDSTISRSPRVETPARVVAADPMQAPCAVFMYAWQPTSDVVLMLETPEDLANPDPMPAPAESWPPHTRVVALILEPEIPKLPIAESLASASPDPIPGDQFVLVSITQSVMSRVPTLE
jgi:hypothetical protein